jgi:biopolymer transport protein ExbD
VDVALPNAVNTITMPENPEVVLSIRKDGTLYIKDKKVTLENLQSQLEEAFLTVADKKLYLRADSDLEYGKIVDLIDVIREAGVEVVGIITEKKAEKSD